MNSINLFQGGGLKRETSYTRPTQKAISSNFASLSLAQASDETYNFAIGKSIFVFETFQ